ncbi:cation:proton antiporter [Dysgonomonas sp. BGC7]|uniref:cation:proton antiporter n=1 Tax=Dysgonomonas sp. BGC7 TaxID=1658008 RepID=UPI00068231BA|nr:cation:proton antiporter [Dysgonomonas sp. BGC7]MBD8388515.1 cation:proton antiporter [Dysgonomonas sp. BGC7]
MKKYKNLLFYITTIGVFSILILITLNTGKANLEKVPEGTVLNNGGDLSAWNVFLQNLLENIATPTITLLLQIIVILIVVKLFGWLCKLIGQTTVIGEIIAGVVLGPSLLGYYFPEVSQMIFPPSSLGNIGLLSQIGLILFMFIIGMELDLRVIRNRAQNAVIISHASIIFPFTLGIILAYFIYEEFTHAQVSFISFALFMGIAMSITAFPVLARIVHEKGINKLPIGPIVITCAAIDDITAWCLLAAVIAIVKAGSFSSSIFVILMAVTYVIVMFKVVRPVLKRMVEHQHSKSSITKSTAATFFILLFISAYTTELIGIHALFGAFLAGVIMPSDTKFRNLFTEKIEYVSLIVLLPLFFVYTGLRTEIGLLNTVHLWLICGLIIAVAITGKFLGSAFAARFVGQSWKDSLTIGALMNTRGLMELVVLNIGLDLGILTPQVFAMMVIMALGTTFMTSPSLSLIDRIFKRQHSKSEVNQKEKFRILIPFASPETGRKLLLVAHYLVKKKQTSSEVAMLHTTEGNLLHQYNIQKEEDIVFKPIINQAKSLNQEITKIFEVTNDRQASIIKTANKGEYDFVLIGSKGYTVSDNNILSRFIGFSNTLEDTLNRLIQKWKGTASNRQLSVSPFDDRTRRIISKTDMQVGIFIDRGLVDIQNVFVPILDEDDSFIGQFLERLAGNSNVRITLWDSIHLADKSLDFVKSVRDVKSANPYLFQAWHNNIPVDESILQKHDLIILSIGSWKKLEAMDIKLIKAMPSTLILTDL